MRLAIAIVKRIAGAPNGPDWIDFAIQVKRAAQAADMHIHRPLVDVNIAAPYAIEKLRAREYVPRPLHQKFKQPELGRAKLALARATQNAPLVAVELNVATVKCICHPLRPSAPQQGADAREKLGNRERLHDIIVGAGGEAA